MGEMEHHHFRAPRPWFLLSVASPRPAKKVRAPGFPLQSGAGATIVVLAEIFCVDDFLPQCRT